MTGQDLLRQARRSRYPTDEVEPRRSPCPEDIRLRRGCGDRFADVSAPKRQSIPIEEPAT